jgi:peptidoglycan/xylan/chitin deacetylase (PgdA/CDA1 family)
MVTRVPILLYHGLWTTTAQLAGRSRAELHYWLHARDFAAQMHHLAACGYTAVPLAALLTEQGAALPAKPVILTFDDGWASDWQIAAPILHDLGWQADLFLIVNKIGAAGYMTWGEVRQAAAVGISIHSHSLTHCDLSRLSPTRLCTEVAMSKTILQQRLGHTVDFFALPYGAGAMKPVEHAVQAAGYRGLCTSQVGVNAPGANLFRLRRIPVTRTTSCARLEAWVQGQGLSHLALRQMVSRSIARTLGTGLYGWMKEYVLRTPASTGG